MLNLVFGATNLHIELRASHQLKTSFSVRVIENLDTSNLIQEIENVGKTESYPLGPVDSNLI